MRENDFIFGWLKYIPVLEYVEIDIISHFFWVEWKDGFTLVYVKKRLL